MRRSEALVRALRGPGAWPHGTGDTELIETHISWVILAGEHAYKIKKPVRLSFLDFSTLEKRRYWCTQELELNRRWAPELYLEVVPIAGSVERPVIGGDGEPIEFAVRMRRFPQSAILDEQLEAGKLDEADMRELATTIASGHGRAPVHAADDGSSDYVRQPMLDNFEDLSGSVDEDRLHALRRWTVENLDRLGDELLKRRRDGFVRECHGDLHLKNLVKLDERIVPFDCLEFSPELRTIDVMSDTAFLVMDLWAQDRRDLGFVFLNRYLERSGDYDGMQVFGLYFVYHCLIRAKVLAIRSCERETDEDRDADLAKLRHYCSVAEDWIDRPGPALVLMHGYSASGKTSLSSALLAGLAAVRVRSDIERKRLHELPELASSDSGVAQGMYAEDASRRTYQCLLDIARKLLAAGYRSILDASFLDGTERRRARELAGELDVPLVIVSAEAPEAELRRRIEARRSSAKDASEADSRVLDYQLKEADPLAPDEKRRTIRLDTTKEAAEEEALRRVSAAIGRHRRR